MSELPQGWASATLGEIAAPRGEKANPTDLRDLPFVGLEEVEAHTGRIVRMQTTAGLKSSVALFGKGDLLYGRLRPYLNKVVLTENDGAASAEFIVFPPSPAVDQSFLQRTLMSPEFVQFAGLRSTGDRPRVSFDAVSDYVLPVPPLPEQRRIVAKIDSLTGKSRRARNHLDHIPRLVEKYKQAVLAAAFRGDLTREWRARHRPIMPSLEQLLQERQQLFQFYQQRLRPCDVSSIAEGEQPYELPPAWSWVRAEAICGYITKGTTPPSSAMSAGTGEIPYIKVYNLTFDGTLDFTIDPTFVSKVTHDGLLARSKVFSGDVLMNIVGPPLGKVSIVPGVRTEWNINQAIAIFRPVPAVSSAFLAKWLSTDVLTRWAVSRAKATVGQSNLTLEICRDLPVPLCSAEEQREIMRRIDSAMMWVDRLASEATSASGLIDQLDKAVVAKAFRGDLAPQDPEDEPASLLLERIRTERGAMPRAKVGRKAKV